MFLQNDLYGCFQSKIFKKFSSKAVSKINRKPERQNLSIKLVVGCYVDKFKF